jgi:hypothetical protein
MAIWLLSSESQLGEWGVALEDQPSEALGFAGTPVILSTLY